MTNILITGGLGYIGQELCYLYSGESEKYKITILDINFFSERNERIAKWGLNYIQGDILNDDLMARLIPEFDIIYHFAGITNVAYTKSEDNLLKSNISEVGVKGTKNIIRYMKDEAKIIFPSTHVVFEGLNRVKKNIKEHEKPKPVLTYSKSKYQSELDIINSNKKFIICRLASVYGFSYDSMRIGIMPNLFSKMSSLGQTIKLFSNGIQLKSLVSVKDVSSFFKFIAHSDYENEIFHISNENISVKEVSQILKEINPNLMLQNTNDEIPNAGYSISNEKAISTGFIFKNNLKDSLTEMYQKWTLKRSKIVDEYVVKGSDNYIDSRGIISNYELSEPINLIGYIESKKGTVRANHYHPIQEQKCLLIKGQYISVTRNLYNKNSVIETRIINEGDLAVIKPNVAHTMVFTKNSIFLNLVNGERKHENYGITHTIPYELVSKNLKNELLDGYALKCRVCGNNNFKEILSLGFSPLANNLEKKPLELKKYLLELVECDSCGNFQLSYNVNPKLLFSDYKYKSSVGETFINHFKLAAKKYIDKYNLTSNSLVIDIGSNDGIALVPFVENSISVVGIEPSRELCEISNEKGIKTINSFFDKKTTNTIISNFGKADLILASNVFAHIDNLNNVFKNLKNLLNENGTIIVEIQYQLDMFENILFDNIYHEHYNYWTANTFSIFVKRHNLYLNDFEKINTHGGSLRLYISRSIYQSKKLLDLIKQEKVKINDSLKFNFKNKIISYKTIFKENLKRLKEEYTYVSGYGAPAKATTLLNYFGIDNKEIDFIYEDNSLKHELFVPGTGIKILPTSKINIKTNKIIIVFAWNFHEEILLKNKKLISEGLIFISVKDLMTYKHFES